MAIQILRCYECKEIMFPRDEGEDYLKGYYGGLCVECNDKLSSWSIFQAKYLGSIKCNYASSKPMGALACSTKP